MASAITNHLRSSSLLIFATFLFYSCTVKYYNHNIKNDLVNISNTEIRSYLPEGFPDNLDEYSLQMNSLYFYKNNIRENMLMTSESKHTKRVTFFENNDSGLPNKFQRFEVWLAKRKEGNNSLVPGEKAVMVSYKSKKDSLGVITYEIVKVFLGKIQEKNIANKPTNKITIFKPEYLLEYTGKSTCCAIKKCKKSKEKSKDCKSTSEDKNRKTDCYCNEFNHKIKRKRIKRNGKTDLNMEAILELKLDTIAGPNNKGLYLEFGAIINNNYSHFAAEKSMIYDLTQIYGEPVWLIKK